MSATYRGMDVHSIWRDRKRDEYHLIGVQDDLLAILKGCEFLSQPQLRRLPLNGRYRFTDSQVHSGATRQSRRADPRANPLISGWPNFTLIAWDLAEPEPPIENAGIRAGEIEAFRAWRLWGARLTSIYVDAAQWLPGVPMTGDVDRQLGVHAFKHSLHLERYLQIKMIEDFYRGCFWMQPARTPPPSVFVLGTVALWGQVVEHERGYRAQFARIKSLDTIYPRYDAQRAILDPLRARYLT